MLALVISQMSSPFLIGVLLLGLAFGIDAHRLSFRHKHADFHSNVTIYQLPPTHNGSANHGAAVANTYSQFQIEAVRQGKRFESGKRYWAFSGGDAIVVENKQDAAWFHLDRGQLMTQSHYVHLEVSNGYAVLELDDVPAIDGISFTRDRKVGLQVSGPGFSLGKGQGLYCVSNDGIIFAVASKMPPFPCERISLRPKGEKASPAFHQLALLTSCQQYRYHHFRRLHRSSQQGRTASQPPKQRPARIIPRQKLHRHIFHHTTLPLNRCETETYLKDHRKLQQLLQKSSTRKNNKSRLQHPRWRFIVELVNDLITKVSPWS